MTTWKRSSSNRSRPIQTKKMSYPDGQNSSKATNAPFPSSRKSSISPMLIMRIKSSSLSSSLTSFDSPPRKNPLDCRKKKCLPES
ncbi:hypothetical protein PGTUg99_004619 [Puccinia graminis f. sp. tritici]|uniref:Uncharacterized protein n=1 Tax=Puccinia graminis f. sp. tritici TaxID=56615 RepID=A0A5B0RBG7_PUCGR|nr:hypothetical protein PGTUg99_004619 [Puccinia graminis f. sp. tritici]